ncbi:MAG: ferritin family protein [Chloroflexota bacterium]
MSIYFSGSELINVAIGIERRGITFYDAMVRRTGSDVARDTFQYLADAERQHVRVFEDMLGDAGKFQPQETYEGEYTPYFQSLVDSAVFSDDLVAGEMAAKAGSDVHAVEMAIGAEKDSILFYYGMREVMHQQAHAVVERIITEEKAHLKQLSELKKGLKS